MQTQLAHRIARDVVCAAGATAALLFVAVGLLLPDAQDRDLSAWEQSAEEAVLAAVLIPSGYVYLRRVVTRSLAWARLDRQASAQEARALLELPSRIAMQATTLWAAIAAAAFAWNVVDDSYEQSLVDEFFNASSVLLAGFTFAGVAYLVTDSRLRPAYSAVLAVHPPIPRRRVNLHRRLVLSWALGSGIPVVIMLILIAWRRGADLDTVIAFLAAATLCGGGAFTVATARTIANPLEELHQAVVDVARGNLAVAVPVRDATEIGVLQTGFNSMTAGLRERERLQDLFGRHVGADIARIAVDQGVDLGGHRAEVTVLFVDLVGSTTLATTAAPERVVETLNRFFRCVIDATTAEGGWVNKFHGDGALCVFGAPVPQPSHADSALRAATAMVGTLRHFSFEFGIGISSGVVVAGHIGTEERLEYTVIGDPVNEAARLSEEAKSTLSKVLASGSTVQAAAAEASGWRRLRGYKLRGRHAETAAYAPAITDRHA